MPSLGELTAHLEADTSGLKKGTREANSALGTVSKRMKGLAKDAAKLGSAAAAAGTAMFTGLVKQGLAAVDSQAKLARTLGGTIDGVRGLQIVAADNGVEGFTESLERMNRRLGDAEDASGPAAKAINALGLNAEKLGQMNVDERVAEIADAVERSGMSSQESARQLQRLGFRQGEANALFRAGGDAIRDAASEVQAYGLSLSEVDAAKVEQANDAMSRNGRLIEGIRQQLAVQLAPVLKGIAELWNDNARAAGGFRGEIETVVESGVKGFAKFMDVVQSVENALNVLDQGAKVLGTAMRAELGSIAQAVVEGPFKALNQLIELANKVPKVNIGQVEMPQLGTDLGKEVQRAVEENQKHYEKMRAAMSEPLPSKAILEWYDNAKQKSREAAQAAIDARGTQISSIASLEKEGASKEQKRKEKEAQQEKKRLQQRLERLRKNLQSEREAEIETHQNRLDWLEEARENELVGIQDYNKLKEKVERDHQHKMSQIERDGLSEREKFERASMSSRVSTMANDLSQMTSDVSRENKAMFNINKAAAIATATMEGIKGAEKTWNAYPYPWNIPMTAAHVAGTASRLSQLKSSSFSGGSSGGSTAAPSQDSGQGSATTTPAAGGSGGGSTGGTSVDINLVGGDEMMRKNARTMIEVLNDAIGDGAQLRSN